MPSPAPSHPANAEHPAEAAATVLARALVAALIAHEPARVLVCPGSRSAPLAYALAAAADCEQLAVEVRLDERAAAFTALGTALGTEKPGVVVTTSGTATANLHPAICEADHAGVPLFVITADRPHELRGTGASQTTRQPGLFTPAIRAEADIPTSFPPEAIPGLVARLWAAALGTRTGNPGPVHLNIAFREPLVPNAPWDLQAEAVAAARQISPPRVLPTTVPGMATTTELVLGPRTVVIAGAQAGPAARELAEAGRWPLLAEPTSGARAGQCALADYQDLLRRRPTFAAAIERIVVFGHPTLSRPISQLLAARDKEIIVVAPTGIWTDVAGTAALVTPAATVEAGGEEAAGADDHWLKQWRQADRETGHSEVEMGLAPDCPLTSATAAHLLWEASQPGGVPGRGAAAIFAAINTPALFIGASGVIRAFDRFGYPTGDSPTAFANRGLAGIDGTIATAWGVARTGKSPVRAVVGDLTFLHDAAALQLGEAEDEVNLQVVVLDDHGGAIFTALEYGQLAQQSSQPMPHPEVPQSEVVQSEVAQSEVAPEFRPETFTRFFLTPQTVTFRELAESYHAGYQRVRTVAELQAALAEPIHGRSVIHVVLAPVSARNQG